MHAPKKTTTTMPTYSLLPLSFLFLLLTLITTTLSTSNRHALNDACRLTSHRSLCIHTLSSFSPPSAHRTMQWWARAAVSATLSETKCVYQNLKSIKTRHIIKGRHMKAAVSNCVECLGDATWQLRQSEEELQRLRRGGAFEGQMSDVETWVSSALTNQDTCRELLAGNWRGMQSQVGRVREQVLNATYCSSNALALIVNLASEGGTN